MARRSPLKPDGLPDTLYVKMDGDDHDAPWFNAENDFGKLAEIGKDTVVGVYKLEQVVRVSATPRLEEA